MAALTTLLPVFFMLALGWVSRQLGWVSPEAKAGANAVVFDLLFPIMIFNLMASASLDMGVLPIVGYVFVMYLLAILVIYLSIQNPDLYITDRGPAFNTRAFTEWLEDPLHRKNRRILGFVIRNYNDERSMYGGAQMDQGLALMIHWLVKQFPDLLLFYLRGGNFCVAGVEEADWEGIRRKILERFRSPWQAEGTDLYLDVTYVEIGLSGNEAPPDRIVNMLIYALDEAGDSTDIEQTLMPEEMLKEFDRHIEIKRRLDQALDQDAAEVFLQPIVDCGTGQVIVRDLSEEKVERIRENIARSGFENVRAEVFDAREFDPDLEGKCDIVIADLPCSGLGVIGRKPDIRYHASEEGIASLAALQREILPVVCRYVKPGGTLVYSTCTTTGEENIDNFRWLVKESGFLPVDITDRFPEGLRKETMKDGYVQLLPGTDPCDGFFISVLSRKE